MLKLVCCIKQVPRVTELPWDPRTGTLKRALADGMINPACRHALEAALILKNQHKAEITVITMGPAASEEVLREAMAMGADHGILISDPRMAGADTLVTSRILAESIRTTRPDFDLILCGCHTSDSETAQVGPQIMEELDIPGVSYADEINLLDGRVQVKRVSDNFVETYALKPPALVTVSTQHYNPRYVSLAGLENAFEKFSIRRLGLEDLVPDSGPETTLSPTKIRRVYSPITEKDNIVMKGSARKIVQQLFDQFDDRIGGAIGKDIKDYQKEA